MMNARGWFWAAGCVFIVFIADILVAKAQVLAGVSIPVHFGGAPQFLLLLVTVAFFVVGALIREREERPDVRNRPS